MATLQDLLYEDDETLAMYANFGDEEFQAGLAQIKLANQLEANLVPTYRLHLEAPISDILRTRLKAMAQQVLQDYQNQVITKEQMNNFFSSLK